MANHRAQSRFEPTSGRPTRYTGCSRARSPAANTTVGQNVATVTFPGGIITEVTGERPVVYDLRESSVVVPGKPTPKP